MEAKIEAWWLWVWNEQAFFFASSYYTHILFSGLDFLSKLAALVPRPRHNLVRYHSVFARGCRQPNARMRKLIVPTKRKKTKSKLDQNECKSIAKSESADELIAPLTWGQRRSGEPLIRVFNMMGPPKSQPPPLNPATAIQS
jgi:hypothetical protein